MPDATRQQHPTPSPPRRIRSPWALPMAVTALATAAVAVATLLVACGGGSDGSGVASLPSQTSGAPGSSPSGASGGDPLAYSRCMRAHGVENFPDPNSKGEIQLNATPGNGLGPDDPQMQAATKACQSLMPGPSDAERQRLYESGLKFARCMRSHGVQMPDPQPPSAGGVPDTQSSSRPSQGGSGPSTEGSGPDPNSPQFQPALEACRHLISGDTEMGFSGPGSGK
jgi:hypothetical protein